MSGRTCTTVGLALFAGVMAAPLGCGSSDSAAPPADVDAGGEASTTGDHSLAFAPLAAAVSVTRGTPKTVALVLVRGAAQTGRVTVHLASTAPGLSAPDVTVDGNDVNVVVSATDDTPLGEVMATFEASAVDGSAAATKPLSMTVLARPGALDASFGVSGAVLDAFPATCATPTFEDLAVGADDSLYVLAMCSDTSFAVAHLGATGALDKAYGTQGIATGPSTLLDHPKRLTVAGDKLLVMGGSAATSAMIVRLTSDGKLDASTAQGSGFIGVVGGTTTMGCTGVALASDGSMFPVWDEYVDTQSSYFISSRKLTPNGQNDNGYAFFDASVQIKGITTGVLVTDAGVLPGGVLVSSVDAPSGTFSLSLRDPSTGKAATAFGATKSFTVGAANDPVVAPGVGVLGLVEMSDHSVVTPINTKSGMILARRTIDGALVSTFGTSGNATFAGLTAGGLAVANDKIIVATSSSSKQVGLLRTDKNGVADASFGTSGKVDQKVGTADAVASRVVVQKSGRIVVGFTSSGASATAGVAGFSP